MRKEYHIPVGNPLDIDNLPPSRPDLELPPPETPPAVKRDHWLTYLVAAFVLSAAVPIVRLLPGWSWLEPYDLLLAIPLLLTVVALAIAQRSLTWLSHPLLLVAVLLLCLNPSVPWSLRCLLIAGTLALHVYGFGSHAVAALTVVPMPSADARHHRRSALWILSGCSAVTAVLTMTTLVWDALLPRIALTLLPVMLLVRPTGAVTCSRWQTITASLASWFHQEDSPAPGVLRSPVGSRRQRLGLTLLATALAAVALLEWEGSPWPTLLSTAAKTHESVSVILTTDGASTFERLRYLSVSWCGAVGVMLLAPLAVPWMVTLPVAALALFDVAIARAAFADRSLTAAVLESLPHATDPVERNSVYLGQVVADGSPCLIPRKLYGEHAHVLGDSGSGKTSLFLAPHIEQLARRGDCSVIVVDLKADSHELLATLEAVQARVQREQGVHLPLKIFSNQKKHSFSFNPLRQPYWEKLARRTQTDILCGATGLTYGTDYGMAYYGSANEAVLDHTLKLYPGLHSFAEIAGSIGTVLEAAKKRDLNPEIRKAGVHVQEVMKRLAECETLNVTETTGHRPEVLDAAIDLASVFTQPQLLYFHLSAVLSPSGAPEIARLVTYLLLAAATQPERKHQVYLVIDEFQRMVAGNLEYILQLARSMGVGVILANQSMSDLRKGTTDLIPALEANCRLRQWLAVSSLDDAKRLIEQSGLTVDYELSRSVTVNARGEKSRTSSATEKVVPRLTINDIAAASDHRFRSIVKLTRGDGYAQYRGLPFIVESGFHISAGEYARRRAFPWPELPGSFLPGSRAEFTPVAETHGPVWSEEILSPSSGPLPAQDLADLQSLFDSLPAPPPTPRKRRKRP